jgi:hypothetical protein
VLRCDGPGLPRWSPPKSAHAAGAIASYSGSPAGDDGTYAVLTPFELAVGRASYGELAVVSIGDASADVAWAFELADEADAVMAEGDLDATARRLLAAIGRDDVHIDGHSVRTGRRLAGSHTVRSDIGWDALSSELAVKMAAAVKAEEEQQPAAGVDEVEDQQASDSTTSPSSATPVSQKPRRS